MESDDLWVFEDVDFAGVAKSMGCKGIRVEYPDRGSGRRSKKPWRRTDRLSIDVATDIDAMAPTAYLPE